MAEGITEIPCPKCNEPIPVTLSGPIYETAKTATGVVGINIETHKGCFGYEGNIENDPED